MSRRPSPAMVIDDEPLKIDEVVAIADGAHVELGPVARMRIAASRAVVDRLAAGDTLIYGLNTGLGHLRNTRIPAAEIEADQPIIIRAHDGAIGPPLARRIVRAAMVVRVAGIARGGSGASPGIAEAYVAMLNAGVTPVVPEIGSVGASDLGHLAAIARVAIGEGSAELDGAVRPAADALRAAGIDPLLLAPKDGLTVVSANGVSVGHAALVADRARHLAAAADAVAAVSLEAARANLSIVDPVAAAAKPVPGQAVVAERIRDLLEGSSLCTGAASVQDPLSFRVIPQVHGAFREVVLIAIGAVEGELAAMDDNPLVSIEEGRMLSNGNFHPMLMTLAIDALRPAIAHVGILSDRRANQLWDRTMADPVAMSAEGEARLAPHGAPLLRYSTAARVSELRFLAGPASLDIGPLDLGVEDHATNAPAVVRRTDEALDVLEDVLAGELLTAAAAIDWQADLRPLMGSRTRAILDNLDAAIARLTEGASTAAIHAAARDQVHHGLA